MILEYEYTTEICFRPSVNGHNILLRCLPADEPFQHIRHESLTLTDGFWANVSKDGLGNRIVSGGTRLRHNHLRYTSRGTIDMTTYCIPDTHPHPMYALESTLTTSTEGMHTLLPILTGCFLDDCLAIMHRVHKYIRYKPGTTNILTSAEAVFRSPEGVCQDFAHLMIALCRTAGMHARYACGLLMGEGQTHAWVEVHDGMCWYAFDPTNDTAIATGYIKLAHGRDALDCPVSRGMYVGVCEEATQISVIVKELINE